MGSPISSCPPSLQQYKETCVLSLVPAPNHLEAAAQPEPFQGQGEG